MACANKETLQFPPLFPFAAIMAKSVWLPFFVAVGDDDLARQKKKKPLRVTPRNESQPFLPSPLLFSTVPQYAGTVAKKTATVCLLAPCVSFFASFQIPFQQQKKL